MAKQKAIYIKITEEKHHELKVWCALHKTDISTLVRNALDKTI